MEVSFISHEIMTLINLEGDGINLFVILLLFVCGSHLQICVIYIADVSWYPPLFQRCCEVFRPQECTQYTSNIYSQVLGFETPMVTKHFGKVP